MSSQERFELFLCLKEMQVKYRSDERFLLSSRIGRVVGAESMFGRFVDKLEHLKQPLPVVVQWLTDGGLEETLNELFDKEH